MFGIVHWFLHFTGADNVSGTEYGFWSGFAGDLTLFTATFVFYRKHNCHVRWCPGFGHYDVTDPRTKVTHRVCRFHNPLHVGRRQLTAKDLREWAKESYPELRSESDPEGTGGKIVR